MDGTVRSIRQVRRANVVYIQKQCICASLHILSGVLIDLFINVTAYIFLPLNISLLPGGPGNLSTVNPADCNMRRTTPLAQ